MRIINFAKRNIKELLRDPMSLVFCIALPLFFLIIFQQFKIPSAEYSIENFTPSIIIFSYAFISLFTGELVAKDRSSSLLTRLFASPMKPMEYVLGYALALIPLSIIQSTLFFFTAIFYDLPFGINTILTILILIPISLMFILLGILIGCISTDKQAPALGSLIVQLVAFTSGMWFNIDMASGFFKWLCKILPFSHTVDTARIIINNLSSNLLPHIGIIIIYIIIIFVLTIVIFKRKMYEDKK